MYKLYFHVTGVANIIQKWRCSSPPRNSGQTNVSTSLVVEMPHCHHHHHYCYHQHHNLWLRLPRHHLVVWSRSLSSPCHLTAAWHKVTPCSRDHVSDSWDSHDIFPSLFLAEVHISSWCRTTCMRSGVAASGDHLQPHSQPPLTSSFGDKEQAFGCCSGVAHRASPIFIQNKIFYLKKPLKCVVSLLLYPIGIDVVVSLVMKILKIIFNYLLIYCFLVGENLQKYILLWFYEKIIFEIKTMHFMLIIFSNLSWAL